MTKRLFFATSACSVPSLCSIHAACSDDMIQAGKNGLLFDPSRPEFMLDALHDALTRPDLDALGRRAHETARAFSVENMAESFRRAMTHVRKH